MATFDARAAKQLLAGQHLTVNDAPGLRLEATGSTRTWAYRYKSPISGLMKQLKLGAWPEMGLAQAVAAWIDAKAVRDAGRCPATERRAARAAPVGPAKAAEVLTVQQLLSLLAYFVIVAAGAVPVLTLFGAAPCPGWHRVLLDAVLCLAVFAVRGNLMELFRSTSGDGRVADFLRRGGSSQC
ncbi:phage holin family protein [Mitsuaria sp. WAJ17]|uniref:integrase arm-type DNA-binding domain-containing protein n=1 Tax=Mitsuaria sp. WAJ17 TaxID=2761452 RepID=UPI0016041FE3|nr:phage holin family protein [Mitsuaria sp. WAJ17]MBB2486311.1 phage holin family protein [Mitsuaria sp. WAJ17]